MSHLTEIRCAAPLKDNQIELERDKGYHTRQNTLNEIRKRMSIVTVFGGKGHDCWIWWMALYTCASTRGKIKDENRAEQRRKNFEF